MGFKLLPFLVLVSGRGFEGGNFIFGDVLRLLLILGSEESNDLRILGDWLRVDCGTLHDLPDTRVIGVQEDAKRSAPLGPVGRGQ